MTLRPNLFQHLFLLLLLVILAAFTTFLGLFWLATPTQAAPPRQPFSPQPLSNFGALTITPTKISDPVGIIQAGKTLTFTIAFKSNVAGTIIITDAVPAFTSYKPGSISSLVATTTNIVTPDDSDPGQMAWTMANNVPNSLINLSFSVVVDTLAPTGTQIVNTAWLSDSNDITSTAPITLSVANSIRTVFLPFIDNGLSFSGDSRLLVHSINTGGVSVVEVRSIPDDTLVLLCGMSDNTTGLCGTLPAGQYNVIATTLNCGQIKTVETIAGEEHTVTAECFTSPQATQLYLQTSNTGGNVPVQVRTNPGNNLALSCNVGDNTTQLCGSVQSGSYTVTATTSNCGQQTIAANLSGSQVTLPISCTSTVTTQLYIETNSTGGVATIEVRTPAPGNVLKLSCAIPDETVQLCGPIAAGTYKVTANTVNCGTIIDSSVVITGTQQTVPVSCGSFRGVWSGKINEYFAE